LIRENPEGLAPRGFLLLGTVRRSSRQALLSSVSVISYSVGCQSLSPARQKTKAIQSVESSSPWVLVLPMP